MTGPLAEGTALAVERVARESYGRLVAWLAAHCGDLALAEDAMGDALSAALSTWPEQGVPSDPQAWLLTAARRRVIDRVRRQQTRDHGMDRLRQQAEEIQTSSLGGGLVDRRLELLFVCAHPEIDAQIRTPLMLQTVLGLSAQRIGSAFLLSPTTLGQRLVRAKRRIQELGLSMELPAPRELQERLTFVLEAIYAAFGTHWDHQQQGTLDREALWLASLLATHLPQSAEAKGLYALILFCSARQEARRTSAGDFVPLHQQDTALWNHAQIATAEATVRQAAALRQPGPFQLEAAIQSIHAHRHISGQTNHRAILTLYRGLARMAPSLGAHIGMAASFQQLGRASEGLEVLDQLPKERVVRHQPYWAVRAHLLRDVGQEELAQAAFGQAIALCSDPAIQRWLRQVQAGV